MADDNISDIFTSNIRTTFYEWVKRTGGEFSFLLYSHANSSVSGLRGGPPQIRWTGRYI